MRLHRAAGRVSTLAGFLDTYAQVDRALVTLHMERRGRHGYSPSLFRRAEIRRQIDALLDRRLELAAEERFADLFNLPTAD